MKKSPIQKLSPYANKLVTAASSAVQQGTQLSNAVVYKARNVKAEECFDKILRSPPDNNNNKSPMRRKIRQEKQRMSDVTKKKSSSSPPRSSSNGVRDRIHQFDSASKSSSSVDIRGRSISSQSPYYHRRGCGNRRRYQTSPGRNRNSVRREDDNDGASNARNEKVIDNSNIMPLPEKENELNSTSSSSSYAFTSKDGVQKLSPARKTKKKKNRVDKQQHEHYNEMEGITGSEVIKGNDMKSSSSIGKEEYFGKGDDRKKKKMMIPEVDVNNDIDQHKQRAILSRESSSGTTKQQQQQQKKSNRHPSKATDGNTSNMTIEQLNHAAVTSSTKNNNNNDTTTVTKYHRNTTYITDNVIPKSFDSTRNKKRESPTKHELIQSPLRKHIKVVHQSATSNATCTMMKEPFQLMLPYQLDDQREEKEKNYENDNNDDDDEEEEGYLDTLGAVVMGNNTPSKKKMTRRGNKYSDDDNIDASTTNGTKDEKREEEAALDLLSSAAFLFKTSRRNLG